MTETFLSQIELSVRAANVLRAMNPRMTFDDFMALDKRTVMSQRNAGRRTWQEVWEFQTHFRHVALESADESSAATDDLRDRAALAALPAIIAATSAGLHQPGLRGSLAAQPIEDRIAADAYRLADAFMAARETKEDGG